MTGLTLDADTSRMTSSDAAASVLSALASGELTIVERPIASLATGRVTIIGLDVATPGTPPLDPEETRRAAGSVAMTASIDAHLLERAVALAAAGTPAVVSISAESLVDPGLSGRVEDLLLGTPGTEEHVTVAIEERAASTHAAMATEVVARLRAAGCRLMLEEFGVAPAGFGYLRRFPADALKIAPVLVAELEREPSVQGVVAGIVALARSLEVEVIAPGVSDPETLALLDELGVDAVEGPLVAADGLIHEAREHFRVSG